MTFLGNVVGSVPVVLVVFLVLYLAIWREIREEPNRGAEAPLLRRRFGIYGALLAAFWVIVVARVVVIFS